MKMLVRGPVVLLWLIQRAMRQQLMIMRSQRPHPQSILVPMAVAGAVMPLLNFHLVLGLLRKSTLHQMTPWILVVNFYQVIKPLWRET
jgi:hypothetical protein